MNTIIDIQENTREDEVLGIESILLNEVELETIYNSLPAVADIFDTCMDVLMFAFVAVGTKEHILVDEDELLFTTKAVLHLIIAKEFIVNNPILIKLLEVKIGADILWMHRPLVTDGALKLAA